jgi:hypothetical protein
MAWQIVRFAFHALLERVPKVGIIQSAGAGADTSNECPSKRDYPRVKYWTWREWMGVKAEDKQWTETSNAGSQHGRTCAAQGINVGMCYVEDKDGNPIDGTKTSAMRQAAHLIWVHISLNSTGGPPPTWGKADVSMVQAAPAVTFGSESPASLATSPAVVTLPSPVTTSVPDGSTASPMQPNFVDGSSVDTSPIFIPILACDIMLPSNDANPNFLSEY